MTDQTADIYGITIPPESEEEEMHACDGTSGEEIPA